VNAIENRSTGFQWQITENGCLNRLKLKVISDVHRPGVGADERESSGAAGKRKWVFLTPDSYHEEGTDPCTLEFSYMKPWLRKIDSRQDIKKLTVFIKNE